MEDILNNLKNHLPLLSQKALITIYEARFERLRMLMHKGIPMELHWLIEAKVRLAGEFSDSFNAYMPGLGKSSFAKKQRAKRLHACYKCARTTCNTRCCSLGMVSVNLEDKSNSLGMA